MQEHTIPESLVESIRSGRAVLVVGARVGGAGWKRLLEHMVHALAQRGEVGDESAAREVDRLLQKGYLVSAASYLGRTLGTHACDRIVAESWGAITQLTGLARAVARLPFRQVWTTFPGNLLERAMEEDLPDGWPSPRVLTWERAGEFDRRRRTLLKLLGDVTSYVMTPRSIRQMMARAEPLRRQLRHHYTEGSLVLVGFGPGDPDLSALLDRLLGQFEPPQTDHYLIGSGLSSLLVDELMSEHEIQVVNVEAGSEEEAGQALVSFLGELQAACAAAGIGLGHGRPDDDDLEGWLALLHEDPFDEEAASRLSEIEDGARAAQEWERLVEVLMARVEIEGSAPGRASLLREVADVFESRIGDLPRAFTALTAALREDPSDPDALDRAEKLADDTGGWTELIGDIAQVASEIDDREVAAAYWARLGHWYHKKLDHADYALAAYRESVKLDGSRVDSRRGLAELCRQQQRWSELADQLVNLVELEPTAPARVELLMALGELYETQLTSSARAAEAYQRAVDADPDCEDALLALERLYRRDERWPLLAGVLERRAELWEAAGLAQRASVARRELAALRAEKLGDLEGAIARHEAELQSNPRDVTALRALEDLYAKMGRTTAYLTTLEHLCEAAPPGERIGLMRRVAMESEAREGGSERAIRYYERVLEADPLADDALSGLERLYRREGRWDRLAALLERHAAAIRSPAARADKWSEAADVHERELDDLPRAVEAHQNALAAQPDRRDSLSALAALYQRIGQPARSLEVVVRHARLEGERGADRWTQAAAIADEVLGDPDVAEQHLERALAVDPNHEGALIALARVYQETAQWGKAAARLEEAAGVAKSRLERVDLLMEAAATCDEKLGDPAHALELWLAALELDPDHEAAGVRAAQRLDAERRFDQSLPIREMLVRIAPPGDRAARAQRESDLARVSAELGMRHKAVVHYRNALHADPDRAAAAFGLALALHGLALDLGGDERWRESEAAHRELLTRHQAALSGRQVEIYYRLGVVASALGELDKAEDAFRRALEREPRHVPSLEGLVQLAERRGDWRTVVAARRELMEGVDEETRLALLGQIGDIHREKLGDPAAALAAYQEGIQLRPGSFALLHKVLEVHTETKQWHRALDALARLAASETEPRRRAKYHFAAGAIARDEIGEPDLAVEQFTQALEDDPSMDRALRAIDPLLRQRGEFRGLARVYRRIIKRLGDHAAPETLLPLWTGLGQLCLEQLGDSEAAIAAFEVAASLDPGSRERHEQLVELYLEAGESRRQDAIDELQILIQADPDRVELYRALSNLYREENETDKAFCLAQALVFLRAASGEEQALYRELRPAELVAARRRLTEDVWQKAILHAREDRRVNAIFASLVGGIAAATAQPPAAFHLSAKDRVDTADDSQPLARLLKYAAGVLGIEPDPQLYVLPGTSDGLRVANTTERGRLRPALLVGEGHVERVNEVELAFDLGKRLAYLRPDRYVNYAMSTLAMLEGAFAAALFASGVRGRDQLAPEAQRLAEQLTRSVPEPVLAQVASIARQAAAGELGNGEIPGWRTATDLTANRVGFILCNDLETAARRVAVESAGVSTLPAKDRLRDLLAYSVSEQYFGVRRHLGLALEARRGGGS